MQENRELQLDLARLIISVTNFSHLKPEDINPDQSLMRDGIGLDSIDILEIVVHLEKNYGFKIRNDDTGRLALQNIRSLAEYVHNHRTKEHRLS